MATKIIRAHHWTGEKTMTLLVVAFCVVVILVYDLMVVLFYQDVNATVSNTIYQASKRAPIIAFLAGVLCGHLFWPITKFPEPKVNIEYKSGVHSGAGDEHDSGQH
ncbi:MAG: hypothetical protein QXU32_09490 [Nitrososphaerales archaeon]